jgi:hypothetical protein
MSDLIKREDAIETAYQLRHKPNDAEWAEWLKAFNAIPSADRPQVLAVEPKQGTYRDSGEDDEWYGHWAICNECGAEWMGDENFCPNCGARMKGAAL